MEHTKGLCMGCMEEIGEEQICPVCGFDNNSADNGNGLPIRTTLGGKYIVGKILDSGGEGITYIGREIQNGKVVRIREFFPSGICERNTDGTININRENAFSYNESLICFIELAKTLASLNGNENLLNIIDIFEAGNTAYYVAENISGITLREFLLRNGGQLTWEQARSLFLPLLPTISKLHQNNIIHRGISPETLLVGRDGKIRIIGFCIAAARTVRSDISARLFPGFAAIEQYGFDAQQGPWTDVYSIAATLFRTLVGNPPPEATERVVNDNMTIPAKLAQELPKNVLVALANALQIMPENRTKSIKDLRTALMMETPSANAVTVKKGPELEKVNTFFKKYGVLTIAGAATIVLILIAVLIGKNWGNILSGAGSLGDIISMPTSSGFVYNDEMEVAKAIDFKGMTCAEVIEYYEKLGFKDIEIEVISKEYNDEYNRGEIYKQKDKVGTELNSGAKLQVYVSLGSELIKLPDFVKEKMTYKEARIQLLEMGFLPENIVDISVKKLGAKSGVVFKMEPEGGTKVSAESKIKLSFYEKIEDIEVKGFVGKNYYNDIKGNKDYSVYKFEIEEEYSEKYDEGIIISQSAEKGTKIKNTDKITLTVSLGKPPKMPNLRNMVKVDAENELKERKIDYVIVEQYNQSVAEGKVIGTNPSANQTVGGTVTVYISKGAKPIISSSSEIDSSVSSEVVSSQEQTTSSGTTSTDATVSQ